VAYASGAKRGGWYTRLPRWYERVIVVTCRRARPCRRPRCQSAPCGHFTAGADLGA